MEIVGLFLKGVVIGVGKMLPGVSGGMIAMMLGVYEKAVSSIAHFSKNRKENFHFLFWIGLGIILSIILSSKFLLFFLKKYYLSTMLFFIGLMLGGIFTIYKKAKKDRENIFITGIIFSLMILFNLIPLKNQVIVKGVLGSILLVFIGIIEAATMVFPGVSGTGILMLLGYYETIITSLSHLTSFASFFLELPILLPFGIGIMIGIFIFIGLVDYLLKTHMDHMYACIFGFASSSIFLLFIETLKRDYLFYEICFGFFFLMIGFLISSIFEMKK